MDALAQRTGGTVEGHRHRDAGRDQVARLACHDAATCSTSTPSCCSGRREYQLLCRRPTGGDASACPQLVSTFHLDLTRPAPGYGWRVARWTRFVLRHRRAVARLLGRGDRCGRLREHAAARRCSRTRSRCRAPTPSRRGSILERQFGDRPDGSFTIVFEARRRSRHGVSGASAGGGRQRGARRSGRPGRRRWSPPAGTSRTRAVVSTLNLAAGEACDPGGACGAARPAPASSTPT